MTSLNLHNHVALVTGGSRGIGAAVIRALAGAGAAVVINYRERTDAAQSLVTAIEKEGGRAIAIGADVAQNDAVVGMFDHAAQAFGAVDILVNNVGGRTMDVAIEDTDLATWRRFIDLNLTHCFICTKMIGGAMLARGQGRIINIASISGMIANRGIGGRHYETAKAALIHFTRATAADWAPHGITVNAICPGATRTHMYESIMQELVEKRGINEAEATRRLDAMIPLGRSNAPEDIANMAAFLASAEADNITGQSFNVDGGLMWD